MRGIPLWLTPLRDDRAKACHSKFVMICYLLFIQPPVTMIANSCLSAFLADQGFRCAPPTGCLRMQVTLL
jgi:hypothetical protein